MYYEDDIIYVCSKVRSKTRGKLSQQTGHWEIQLVRDSVVRNDKERDHKEWRPPDNSPNSENVCADAETDIKIKEKKSNGTREEYCMRKRHPEQ